MTLGLAASYADRFFDYIGNATAPAAPPANTYIRLHIGDPGVGASNLAGVNERKLVSWGAPAEGGAGYRQIANDAEISWPTVEVDTAEDHTHGSLWDDPTAGNLIATGALAANPVLIGDNLVIAVGALVLRFPIAS